MYTPTMNTVVNSLTGHRHQATPRTQGLVSAASRDREDSFDLHSVDLELEAVEKQIKVQVKQAQLRQRKAALESSRTDAHLSQAQRTNDVARPGFVHSGTGVPRSLDAAAVEDASQAPGEDLSPSATTCLRDLFSMSLHRLRQTEILKKDFRSLVEKVRTTSPTTRIIVSGPLPMFQRGIERASEDVCGTGEASCFILRCFTVCCVLIQLPFDLHADPTDLTDHLDLTVDTF
ncbi:hypothetical protein QTP86_011215 [Hemibagrus guttatus]|nr:hypothetical protein QTP86_011215 [Hemibagrus guttatus]